MHHLLEVAGVGAVDHEVGRITRGGAVHLLDGVRQGLPRRQPAIGLHREGNDDGHVRLLCGQRDPRRLFDVVHGDGGHQVGCGAGEGLDLRTMVVLRFAHRHGTVRDIAVAARSKASADDDRRPAGLVGIADVLQQTHQLPVDRRELLGAVAQPVPPVWIGPPGCRFQNQPDVEASGQRRVGPEILPQHSFAFRRPEQVKGGKVGKFLPLQKDQGGLDAAVGHEEIIAELRQCAPVGCHR
ncbi:hypothetical protein D3C72_1626470 [compost metagenome]